MTPELIPPTDTKGLLATPRKLAEYEALVSTIEREISVDGKVALAKLTHAAIGTLTANQVLTEELKEVRKHAVNKEKAKRSQRLQKAAGQRTFNLNEVKKAREELMMPPRAPRVRKASKKAQANANSSMSR